MRARNSDFRYFEWLVSQLDAWDYTEICHIFDDFVFESDIEMDEDRVTDAYHMREKYFEEGNPAVRQGISPSFLEVLTAMLVRYNDYVLVEPGDPPVVGAIFEDILANLDYLGYSDEYFNPEIGKKVCNFLCKKRFFSVFCVKKCDFWTACGVFLRGKFG